jgi:hypothetical protein
VEYIFSKCVRCYFSCLIGLDAFVLQMGSVVAELSTLQISHCTVRNLYFLVFNYMFTSSENILNKSFKYLYFRSCTNLFHVKEFLRTYEVRLVSYKLGHTEPVRTRTNAFACQLSVYPNIVLHRNSFISFRMKYEKWTDGGDTISQSCAHAIHSGKDRT